MDTSNILFIVGGAFVGLTGILEKRLSGTGLGFNAKVKAKDENEFNTNIKKIIPEDLIKFGLIPEFVGRIPIIVGLEELDEAALVQILKKPKNAITKQYKEMFKMDGVALEFEESAIKAVAKRAIELKTGARGLRNIIETTMLDIMYSTPSDKSIKKIIIDEDAILNSNPKIVRTEIVKETKFEEVAPKDNVKPLTKTSNLQQISQ